MVVYSCGREPGHSNTAAATAATAAVLVISTLRRRHTGTRGGDASEGSRRP